jgi:Holliday junction resolvasome RuvABC endonuclease subunit
MRILGIDPGTNCGWALWDGTELVSGVWDLRVRSDESASFRLIRLRSKLNEVGKVEYLFFEAAGFTPYRKAAQVAGQLEGVLLVWAHDNALEYRTVKPGELKRWATGKGRADKKVMIEAARQLTGYTGSENNEADARLIVHWGRKWL